MKTLLALLVALVASPLAAQTHPFEGAISITVNGKDGKSLPLTYLLKDGKVRMDQAGPRGDLVGIVVDPAAQKTIMIMTSQKMFMEMDMSGAKPPVPDGRGAGHKTISRTGKFETIAGYKCEHVMITDDDGSTTDVCTTSEISATFNLPMGNSSRGFMQPQPPGWASQLGAGIFPLKVQKGDLVIYEVKSIEKKSLDAALFAAPEGYQRMSMPAGMPRRPPLD